MSTTTEIRYSAGLIVYLMGSLFSLANAAESSSDLLFRVINERLSHMESVALFKAENQLATENLDQEKIILSNGQLAAMEAGLDQAPVAGFFQAQIDAAKIIQYRQRAKWLTEPIDLIAPNLNEVVRPLLIELGDQIILLLADTVNTQGGFTESQRQHFYDSITVEMLTEIEKELLFNALLAIK
jgi:chorismate mutase